MTFRIHSRVMIAGLVLCTLPAAIAIAQSDTMVRIQYGYQVLDPLDMVTFPDTVVGTKSGAIELRISNTGATPITLPDKGAVVISGDQADAFTITREPDVLLKRDDSTYFDIAFSPPEIGAYSATVTITTSDPVNPVFSFIISGYATANADANGSSGG